MKLTTVALLIAAVLVVDLLVVAAHPHHKEPQGLRVLPSAVGVRVADATVPTDDGSSQPRSARHAHTPKPRLQRAAATALDWDRLAACESGGDWHANTGNGFFGGLQFLQSTWESFDTTRYAARADLATRWQQIVVAARVLRRQGLAAWPACTAKLGWR